MKMATEEQKMILGATRFLSDYFGFIETMIKINGIKQDKRGCIRVIQFTVHAPALDEPAVYIAAWREDMNDWELIRIPC